MPFIRTILPGSPEAATGPLKAMYDAGIARAGEVAQIIQVMSLDAHVLSASMQMYLSTMKRPNALPAAKREMLAVVVSNVNACFY